MNYNINSGGKRIEQDKWPIFNHYWPEMVLNSHLSCSIHLCLEFSDVLQNTNARSKIMFIEN